MTTTDLARTDESSIELLPPSRPPAESARHMLLSHAEMMDTAYRLATPMVNTAMVPARFRGKVEDATAAILYGAELGLNPIQSLQRIIPIHGMPSLEARTMVALLKSRGYKIRTAAQSNEAVTVHGVDLDGDHYESTWTIERARLAGYVPEVDEKTKKYKTNAKGNLIGNEKYLTDPQAMLKAKAQAEVCRDMAPDVLLGISYTSEELQSERWDDPKQAVTPRPSAPVTVDEIFGDTEVVDTQQGDDEPGQGDGNERGDGAESSTGATPQGPADQETPPEPAPASETPKTTKRKAAEKRVFTLVGDIAPPLERDDRIQVYRSICERDDITSTDDLDDAELKTIGDQLYTWSKDGQLNDKIRDLLNAADLAAAIAEENTTTAEGK